MQYDTNKQLKAQLFYLDTCGKPVCYPIPHILGEQCAKILSNYFQGDQVLIFKQVFIFEKQTLRVKV